MQKLTFGPYDLNSGLTWGEQKMNIETWLKTWQDQNFEAWLDNILTLQLHFGIDLEYFLSYDLTWGLTLTGSQIRSQIFPYKHSFIQQKMLDSEII